MKVNGCWLWPLTGENIMLKVIRSPARVCWHIVIEHNGVLVETANTRREAVAIADKMNATMCGWKL